MVTQKCCIVLDQPEVTSKGELVSEKLIDTLSILSALYDVDIIIPATTTLWPNSRQKLAVLLGKFAPRVKFIDPLRYGKFEAVREMRAKSYAVFRYLDEESDYDLIHFISAPSLAYYSLCARAQGTAFLESKVLVQAIESAPLHLDCQQGLPVDVTDLANEFMEKFSVAYTDYLIVSSQFHLNWMRDRGWTLPEDFRCLVIPASGGQPVEGIKRNKTAARIDELILFASEWRGENLAIATGALNRLQKRLSESDIRVTLLGPFHRESKLHTGVDLADRADDWRFSLGLAPYDREVDRRKYILNAKSALGVFVERCPETPDEILSIVQRGGGDHCFGPRRRTGSVYSGSKR